MKRWLITLIATAVVAGFCTVAMAVVQGSHHDMATYVGGTRDTCYPCHGFKETAAGVAGLKTVGSMCYNRCHLGGGAAGAVFPLASSFPERGVWQTSDNTIRISAYAGTAIDKYQAGAHGMTPASIPAPDLVNAVVATGWPYTSASVTTGMECTSCHDVHENANTPFLRAPLSDNTTPANAFCHKCHAATANGAARWCDPDGRSGPATPNGAHPSEASWQNASTRNSNNRLGRAIEFKDRNQAGAVVTANNVDNAVFRNQSYSGAALNVATQHYNPGGKLGDFALSGNVGCYSCHAVHIPPAAGLPQLTVAQFLGGGVRTQADMCVGCHGTTARSANPGTTAYYHPTDRETIVADFSTPASAVYTMSTGTDNIVVNMGQGVGGVYDNGVGGLLTCMSCHSGRNAGASAPLGVHNGTASASIISSVRATCASCHQPGAVQSGTSPNSHHVYGGSTNYNPALGYPATVSYNGTTTVSLTAGLSCDSCHVGNGTAHNWN